VAQLSTLGHIRAMSTLSLIDPAPTMGEQAIAMLNEIGVDDGGFEGLQHPLTTETFPAYITRLLDYAAGRDLPAGYVPMDTYWLLLGGSLAGVSRLRHSLTDSLLHSGGHISYWIRPGERGKGLGTRLLSLTCQKAFGRGIDRVLVTCDRDNVRSVKVIKGNGGVLDSSLSISPDDPELHFWIRQDI
jgi:predicted acetyltransferase